MLPSDGWLESTASDEEAYSVLVLEGVDKTADPVDTPDENSENTEEANSELKLTTKVVSLDN